jgi:hypothetical protein
MDGRMPSYRVFLLTEPHVQPFRDRAPRPGRQELRPTNYEPAGQIEALGPYDAWTRLQGEEAAELAGRPLGIGDVLEEEESSLMICQYWGFDPAAWRSADAGSEPEADSEQLESA